MNRLLAVLGVMISVGAEAAAERNELTTLKVETSDTGAVIRVQAKTTPVFTVFRLQDPDRLVVDIASARRGNLSGHYEGVGPVTGVVVSQFSEKDAEVARLLVGLEKAAKYDVRADGSALVISVDTRAEAVNQPAPIEPPVSETARPSQKSQSAAPVRSSEPQPIVDTREVKRPGSRVSKVAYAKNVLEIRTDGEVPRVETLELESPPRLAFDLIGFSGPSKSSAVRTDALVTALRVGANDGRYRVVVESSEAVPAWKLQRVGGGLRVQLSRRGVTAPSSEVAEIVIDEKSIAPDESARGATVKSIEFKEDGEAGRVEVTYDGELAWKVERPDGRSATLTLDGAKLPTKLERSLDTQDLGTVIRMVSSFALPGTQPRARLVVAGTGTFEERVSAMPGKLSWRITPKSDRSETAVSESKSAGVVAESEAVALEGAPKQRRYVGRKVSFEFKDIDIHNLLRIIADISKKNIVVSDEVNGKVTIRLRNVPWDQALDLILRSKSLGQEDLGNIIRVAPLAKLQQEAQERLERKKNLDAARDLSIQLIPVNYAKAAEMSTRVKELLSARGTVTVDTRTNTLIVKDLPESMGKVRSLVSSLDLQTPQVLIEARVVEASVRYQREIGIQWGGQAVMAQATGNPTGLQFPNSLAATGGIPTGNAAGVSPTPNYAVSLPVGAQDGAGGAIGLVFGSAGSAATLNLRLSALESQGSIKTLSAPRVTTLDNTQARIAQGTSIPFSQVSAAGANTVFVDAILQLAVTPHITQDGSVLMDILANNNQPDPANAGANGQPAIARKEAQTTVLVKDGDTTVLGGIYVRRGSSNTAGLPLLSKIPIIGFFFRNYRELESKDELLIFVSPRILNRQTIAQNL